MCQLRNLKNKLEMKRSRKYIIQKLQQIADSLPSCKRKLAILNRIVKIKTKEQ